MGLVVGLMIFSAGGAWICARHRAAVPAALFTALATLLTVSTPVGAWAPQLVVWMAGASSGSGGHPSAVQVPAVQVRR